MELSKEANDLLARMAPLASVFVVAGAAVLVGYVFVCWVGGA